jgi:hypothetical protein
MSRDLFLRSDSAEEIFSAVNIKHNSLSLFVDPQVVRVVPSQVLHEKMEDSVVPIHDRVRVFPQPEDDDAK